MPKTIIYQLLPRLFTNTTGKNTFNGDITENGCGKFNEINDAALSDIAALGVSHVWYTGVVRHASTTPYGFISHPSNANVVKGKAGSAYAICDYYDVDPDLAADVDRRIEEWKALVQRTHKHNLKVVMDFVPNHVARGYHSDSPACPAQFGASDDTARPFSPNNNFYYLPGEIFVSPVADKDQPYCEFPAKVSGNDAFTNSPSINDWYETVKLNYGKDYSDGSTFFEPRPDTWIKMRDILLFWVSTGVDAFRVDMAEMVPVEFWRWVTLQITARHPHIHFIAETYQSDKYEQYIAAGFNLLYDKVIFYDTVRAVMTGAAPATALSGIWQRTDKVKSKMLYFLENHDEQRLASDFFAANPLKGRPAHLLALTMNMGATMIYAGQELGEKGMDAEGFSGRDGRTTIFDYWTVDTLGRNARNLTFDNSALTADERALKQWYAKANAVARHYNALSEGEFYDLMWTNQHICVDASQIYAYLRYTGHERFIIVLNFSDRDMRPSIRISPDAWELMGCSWNECIQPSDILGNALQIGRDSVENIKAHGLVIGVPANNGVILRF